MPNKELELFCEKQGFKFHTQGRGQWGVNPYYTFEKTQDEETTSFFSIAYTPCTEEIKIESSMGTYIGHPQTLDNLKSLFEAMGIDFSLIRNNEESRKNTKFKMERKMELANRIAAQIQIKYGFRMDKCVSMAMQGEWWDTSNVLSEMSNRNIDTFTLQVLGDIESGKII